MKGALFKNKINIILNGFTYPHVDKTFFKINTYYYSTKLQTQKYRRILWFFPKVSAVLYLKNYFIYS